MIARQKLNNDLNIITNSEHITVCGTKCRSVVNTDVISRSFVIYNDEERNYLWYLSDTDHILLSLLAARSDLWSLNCCVSNDVKQR